MADDADDERPAPGRWFRKVFGILPDPPGETASQRLDRARAWVSSSSAKERANGLSMLAAAAPEEAVEPLLTALNDGDRHVRTMALVLLLGYDPPSKYGERVLVELGGDHSAAVCFVEHALGAGSIGSFGLTQKLLPHLDHLARSAARRRDRRRAALYASQLREHPNGWPLLNETPPETRLA